MTEPSVKTAPQPERSPSGHQTNRVGPNLEMAVPHEQSPPMAEGSRTGASETRETIAAWVALLRPRILGLVVVAMAASAWLSGQAQPSVPAVVHILWGTLWVMAGSVALNQAMESRSDAMMPRTAHRPVPVGRVSRRQAALTGALAIAAGCGYLAWFAGVAVALVAGINAVGYVGLYTPLKSRSPWQTPVGAAAGALPVLLGAAAADAMFSLRALTLFGLLFFWQFPHSMAIAWLYREQFAAAGTRLAVVVDPSGRSAGRWACAGAIALLPLGLAMTAEYGIGWAAGAGMLGLSGLAVAARFAAQPSDRTARTLLRWSLAFLPAILAWAIAAKHWQ